MFQKEQVRSERRGIRKKRRIFDPFTPSFERNHKAVVSKDPFQDPSPSVGFEIQISSTWRSHVLVSGWKLFFLPKIGSGWAKWNFRHRQNKCGKLTKRFPAHLSSFFFLPLFYTRTKNARNGFRPFFFCISRTSSKERQREGKRDREGIEKKVFTNFNSTFKFRIKKFVHL